MKGNARRTLGVWTIALAAVASTLVTGSYPAARTALHAQDNLLSEADLWLVPGAGLRDVPKLGVAAADLAAGRTAQAIPALTRSTNHPILGPYAHLYVGRAHLAERRYEEAIDAARRIVSAGAAGSLGENALWLLADAAEGAGRWNEALTTLQTLTDITSANPPLAHLRLAKAAVNAGQRDIADRALRKVYYDFPLSPQAPDAESALRQLGFAPGPTTFAQDLSRAQLLFNGRRYADARKAFETLRIRAMGDDRSLIDLRLAQCDYHLQRHLVARDALRRYLDASTVRVPEARYYHASATRGLGRGAEFVSLVRGFVRDYPESPLSELALNDLGTYYILANDDATAASVFAEMYRRFPRGTYADRAAWKAGWWAYKTDNYADAARTFESAATNFQRADLRPSWLYWAGRANSRIRQYDAALAAYRTTIADYRNSYYGRIAERRLRELSAEIAPGALTMASRIGPVRMVVAGTPPQNARLVEHLLASGLFDDAIAELRKAQGASGTSPYIEATIAFAQHQKGELRPAITTMRRAYPEFMAEGGEALPAGILKVIFPLDYWGLIRQHAVARNLDPYLVAALVAQESTFQADVRSVANAWGLMQILPSTGRVLARQVGLRGFTTARLTDPETNVRLGTAYFAGLVDDLGDPAYALAAYNAGPQRVSRWRADRPGVDRDEFIDDIPFPETQNYVKRILGTAEDYRNLYSPATRP